MIVLGNRMRRSGGRTSAGYGQGKSSDGKSRAISTTMDLTNPTHHHWSFFLSGWLMNWMQVRLQMQCSKNPAYRGTFHCIETIIKQESVWTKQIKGIKDQRGDWPRDWPRDWRVMYGFLFVFFSETGARAIQRHVIAHGQRCRHQRHDLRRLRQRPAPHGRSQLVPVARHRWLSGRCRPEHRLQPHGTGQNAHSNPGTDLPVRHPTLQVIHRIYIYIYL